MASQRQANTHPAWSTKDPSPRDLDEAGGWSEAPRRRGSIVVMIFVMNARGAWRGSAIAPTRPSRRGGLSGQDVLPEGLDTGTMLIKDTSSSTPAIAPAVWRPRRAQLCWPAKRPTPPSKQQIPSSINRRRDWERKTDRRFTASWARPASVGPAWVGPVCCCRSWWL